MFWGPSGLCVSSGGSSGRPRPTEEGVVLGVQWNRVCVCVWGGGSIESHVKLAHMAPFFRSAFYPTAPDSPQFAYCSSLGAVIGLRPNHIWVSLPEGGFCALVMFVQQCPCQAEHRCYLLAQMSRAANMCSSVDLAQRGLL